MLKSELEKISLEFKNIKILSINVDNIPELSKKYNIYSIPAIFLVRNKQIVFNHVGFLPKNNLIKVINDLFK
jgi:thioredoxin-like negative regulator of GroEL